MNTRRPFSVLALAALAIAFTLITSSHLALAGPVKPEPRSAEAEAYLSNNLLRVYISERDSRKWEYQYQPGSWGESNFHELFAVYTPVQGTVESPSLAIEQPFNNPGGGPGSVSAVLSNANFRIRRTVTMPPANARYFLIEYEIVNKTNATLAGARFFQAIDFDIPYTGDHTDDYGWYDPATDYIGVRDDAYFRNIVASVPRSDDHSVDYWRTQIYDDWDDGDLAGRDVYGPGDPAVAKQFNLGNLAPGETARVTFYVWFGDPAPTSATCIQGTVFQPSGATLPGAIVRAIHQTSLAEVSTTTDASGHYLLDNLTPGQYSLNISAPEYTPYAAIPTLGQNCLTVSPTLARVESSELIALAAQMAPDIYQDTDSRSSRGDFITRANYDGNWSGRDNWQNLFSASPDAYVYWDAASTQTHHFLKYYLFYPRDWGEIFPLLPDFACTTDGPGQTEDRCHENDLEGFAIAVNRQTLQVEYMVTRQHGFPPHACASTSSGRPTNVHVDRMAHATWCLREQESYTFPGGDGVIYRYGDEAGLPDSINDRDVAYDLIHVNDLHAIRGTAEGAQAYTRNQRNFLGDDWGENKASTPWGLGFWWLVPNRAAAAATYEGDLYADPARLFASLFPDAGISTDYTFNPNLTAAAAYDPQTGNSAATPAGDAAVYLPFGAVDGMATVTLSYDVPDDLPSSSGRGRANEPALMLGRPFSLRVLRANGSAVASFNAPVQIEASFSLADLAAMEVPAANVRVARWNGTRWESLPTEVDGVVAIAQAYTAVPGVYALFSGEATLITNAPAYMPLIVFQQPAPQARLLNGDFEQGAAAWAEESTHGWPIIVPADQLPGDLPPHSGNWAAWLGGDNDELSLIRQTVTVPPAQSFLTYFHWIASADDCNYDFARVLVNGAPVDQYTLCESNSTSGWVARGVNLTPYAGQTVALEIQVQTDGSGNSNLFVDDVAFGGAGRVAGPPPDAGAPPPEAAALRPGSR